MPVISHLMYAAVPAVGMCPEQGKSVFNLILGGGNPFSTQRYHEYMRAYFDVRFTSNYPITVLQH